MSQFTLYVPYIEDALKFLTIAISSIYIFSKTLKINTNIKRIVFTIINTIMSIIIIILLRQYSFPYIHMLFMLFTCGSLILLNTKSKLNCIFVGIISIAISYCIQFIGVTFVGIILWLVNYSKINIISLLLITIFQFIIVFLLMKTKRVRQGISFFNDKNNLGIGILISGFIIMFSSLGSQEKYISNTTLTLLYISVFISSIGLFLWIRKSITEHYRKKLQDKAEEHYQTALAKKERYIEQLTNSNTYLSKVVHRDNHLMSALQYSIEQLKSCNDENEKDKILNEILTLANERGDLLLKEQKSNKLLAGTGSPIIDGALGNMYVKAAAHNIDFNLVVNEEVHYLINNIISQTDLETLLCDHIKDAIIAINANDNIPGKILVTIEMVDNIYEISIKDNGVDFDVDTLSKLGLERVTTHKDTGGSGIGFMTTFETLEKTNGSLIIIEYENKIPFSKSITFRFDGLNSFIIKSYRSDELKEAINRDYMIIL